MKQSNALEALKLLYNVTHQTQVTCDAAEPDIAIRELIHAMHLNKYELSEVAGISSAHFEELMEIEGACRKENDAAVCHVYGNTYKIYFYTYEAYTKRCAILIIDDMIVTDVESKIVYKFLRCLMEGTRYDHDTLLLEIPRLDPRKSGYGRATNRDLASAAAELYYQTKGARFVLDNVEITPEVVRNTSDERVSRIIERLQFKTTNVPDYVARYMCKYISISQTQRHVLCRYPIDGDLNMFKLLYGDYVVTFMLTGHTLVHNTYASLDAQVVDFVDNGVYNSHNWLPDYVKKVEKAGDNPDYQAIWNECKEGEK